MYQCQWYYHSVGQPQYVSVAVNEYQNVYDGNPYYLVPGQQQAEFFLPTTGYYPEVPVYNSPWYNQLEPQVQGSYAPVAWSSPLQPPRVLPASNQSVLPTHSRRPQYDFPRPSNQGTPPNVQLSDRFPDPNVIRGPPRKPRQSGYALWVGNIPQSTRLQELIDFFAMDGIESVFLIRRSNCAFVNYHTQKTCVEAFTAFHRKVFKNVTLVCQLRMAPQPTTNIPPVPSLTPTRTAVLPSPDPAKSLVDTTAIPVDNTLRSTPSLKRRYFLMKCLSYHEIEWSMRNSIWVTQKHNETVLNEAIQNSEVYLFFSINQSGHFSGYARMLSGTSSSFNPHCFDQSGISPTQKMQPAVDNLRITVTPKTESVPRGKIITDNFRGTTFWEVAESSGEEDNVAKNESTEIKWSLPFPLKWITSEPLPFGRVRNLRNPWNRNLSVKIGRDGTEIEPSVGAMLLSVFAGNVAYLG